MALKSENRSQLGNQPFASEQRTRFEEAARDIGADESENALDRIMDRLDLTRRPSSESDDEGGKPNE